MKVPLYVVLVGETPRDGVVLGDPERSPGFILALVQAANGAKAAPMAQTLSGFFKDDGLLLKKFIFRVEPEEGLKKIEPAVRRIVARPRPGNDLRVLSVLILPLSLFLGLLLGILVRSFPGPGDLELVELGRGAHLHVAADRAHRLPSGGWATTGSAWSAMPRMRPRPSPTRRLPWITPAKAFPPRTSTRSPRGCFPSASTTWHGPSRTTPRTGARRRRSTPSTWTTWPRTSTPSRPSTSSRRLPSSGRGWRRWTSCGRRPT
jgi:hypothetical protein